jgi:hypothetical protein
MTRSGTELTAKPPRPGTVSVEQITKSLTQPVLRLLTSDTDAREVAALVAEDPESRAILTANALALAQAAEPAGADGVRRAMQRLFVVFSRPKKTAEELPFWFAEYYRALGKFPTEALHHAIDRYIDTATIHMIPAPGVLAEHADQKALEIGRIAYRAKLVAALPAPDEVKCPTDEERAEAKAFLADLKAGKLTKKPPESERPRESREAMSNRLRAAAAKTTPETPEAF